MLDSPPHNALLKSWCGNSERSTPASDMLVLASMLAYPLASEQSGQQRRQGIFHGAENRSQELTRIIMKSTCSEPWKGFVLTMTAGSACCPALEGGILPSAWACA